MSLSRREHRARVHEERVEREMKRLRTEATLETRLRCRKCRKGQTCLKSHQSAILEAALLNPSAVTQEAARRLSSS